MSLDFDVFAVDPKPIPSAVPGFEEAVGQATWPPSTSTLISDDGGALLVDCLITEQEARELAAWVKSHDREPGYVYITHPHADHFLGLAGPGEFVHAVGGGLRPAQHRGLTKLEQR